MQKAFFQPKTVSRYGEGEKTLRKNKTIQFKNSFTKKIPELQMFLCYSGIVF